MTQPEPHERLNAAMNERRLGLRMNWREVATAAGISYEALRAIRRGDYRPTELTARGLDEALQWRPGSTLSILDGGVATPLEDAASTPSAGAEGEVGQRPTLSQELQLAQRLLAATVREMGLTPQEADEVWRRVRLEIEVTHPSLEGETGRDGRNDRAG
ncbi:helix-turn-helix domain-containing protein [Streptomyces sp. NY05-11A]|uniref:helix-turn-helix domain-containing protein n=1 Tax=Streptomyces soliscabiei TaxID=588897 RepID=UPI0029B9926F|nr:helix-turn-helix transcriptional regulator [Streptomyces sp. NY05-11A]MDX2681066.1 helix-turn-helix transcriptional regulator [Streptomyces sp. NY05-11A]